MAEGNENNNKFYGHNSGTASDSTVESLYEYKHNLLAHIIDFADRTLDVVPIIEGLNGKKILSYVRHQRMPGTDDQCPQDDDTAFYEIIDEGYPVIIRLIKNSSYNSCHVSVGCVDESTLLKYRKLFEKHLKNESNHEIGLIVGGRNFSIRTVKFEPPALDLNLHYSTSFQQVHQSVLDKLNRKMSGLFIFHGPTGTGKTTYIKHLVGRVKRLFVFVPTNLISELVGPNLINILIERPNTILVLEDAEKAVVKREDSNDPSIVSTILNLSDGILGNLLNTSIIVTFNAVRQSIDNALLRKGRLMVEHTFDKLPIPEAQRLVDHLNKSYTVTEPMNLADIYNLEDNTFHTEEVKSPIGFGAK